MYFQNIKTYFQYQKILFYENSCWLVTWQKKVFDISTELSTILSSSVFKELFILENYVSESSSCFIIILHNRQTYTFIKPPLETCSRSLLRRKNFQERETFLAICNRMWLVANPVAAALRTTVCVPWAVNIYLNFVGDIPLDRPVTRHNSVCKYVYIWFPNISIELRMLSTYNVCV